MLSEFLRHTWQQVKSLAAPEAERSASDVMQSIGSIPLNRSLVLQRGQEGGCQIFKPSDRIRLREGDRVRTVIEAEGGAW